uniref:B12-binding domain-containing radical SAM protein n=1 Tax=Toxocara canis TaxID=6265 RepID=A0A183U6J9_TOXCA
LQAYSEIWWRSSPTGILVTSLYYVIGNKALKKYLELEPKIFWRVANSSWDLIVVDELFTVHGYGIATLQKLQHRTPYIIFSPSLMFFTNYVVSSLDVIVEVEETEFEGSRLRGYLGKGEWEGKAKFEEKTKFKDRPECH